MVTNNTSSGELNKMFRMKHITDSSFVLPTRTEILTDVKNRNTLRPLHSAATLQQQVLVFPSSFTRRIFNTIYNPFNNYLMSQSRLLINV